MRKHAYAIWEQQRHRSACASAQSELASEAEQAGFSHTWSQTPKDRFSSDMVHIQRYHKNPKNLTSEKIAVNILQLEQWGFTIE